MRGSDAVAGALFSYVDLEKRVRPDHPLRVIRGVVNATLAAMSVEFDALYAPGGRESIPPERLLRALLLQAFYTIRSERQLVERIEFDLLFRWFVGLGVDDPVWDATTFTKNRDRLLAGEIASPVPRHRAGTAEGEGAAVERAFLGGRHVAGSLGEHQELSAQGWLRPAARCGPQRRTGFPRPETQQRHACLDHRWRCPAL